MFDIDRPFYRTRAGVVGIARAELGSSDASKYWGLVLSNAVPPWHGPPPPQWCGAFALWCLRQAGLCDWFWAVKGINDTEYWGFLHRLERTDAPKPGDVGYQDVPYRHHFVVADVGEHTIASVDGNQGNPGVQERHRVLDPHKYAFYSIEPLLTAPPETAA